MTKHNLVIAEKPSVARDIARVLGCSKKENGALEGNKYIVTWALGHLVTLKDPEDYDKKYKEWNMAVLPMMPEKLLQALWQTLRTVLSAVGYFILGVRSASCPRAFFGGAVLKWSLKLQCARAYLQHLKTIILWRRTL